jgi:hypothetical protein
MHSTHLPLPLRSTHAHVRTRMQHWPGTCAMTLKHPTQGSGLEVHAHTLVHTQSTACRVQFKSCIAYALHGSVSTFTSYLGHNNRDNEHSSNNSRHSNQRFERHRRRDVARSDESTGFEGAHVAACRSCKMQKGRHSDSNQTCS